jgi:hypothetical protein
VIPNGEGGGEERWVALRDEEMQSRLEKMKEK